MTTSESNFQKKCISYLKENNYYHINVYGGGRTAKGAPDLITCINGKFAAFELKVKNNKMQPDQEIHKIRIERSNGLHFTPYSIEEFIEIVEGISGGAK